MLQLSTKLNVHVHLLLLASYFLQGAVLGLPGAASAALKPCPADSKNCWSAEGPSKNVVPKWSFPAGMSQKDALAV